jgi:ferredoxin--NADP+ reductase
MTIRLAIVGAGPAGFYAAAAFLACGDHAEVDMFERLPTPFGLVRSGVAPDHPKIKSVTRVFDKTAALPRLRFMGNITVGRHVSHEELTQNYDAVLYAVGSPRDRPLGIPGESLPGSHAATDFVSWYNGHPDHSRAAFDLTTSRAIVVGNGNVALDVARMLLLPRGMLRTTDTADHAIAALGASKVRNVVVLGRRGPVQAAFTTPELRELAYLPDTAIRVDPRDLELDPISCRTLEDDGQATARRNLELLTNYSERADGSMPKTLTLRFLTSPTEVVGTNRVAGVRVTRNALHEDSSGRLVAVSTGENEIIEAGLVLRAIGYRGTAMPGLPFDERAGVIPNIDGRVIDPTTGSVTPGVYTAGWIKRGPTGVIGTNKRCAQETVDHILDDLQREQSARVPSDRDRLLVQLAKRQPEMVSYAGWELIDAHEQRLAAGSGRPRVKVTDLKELVRLARPN